MWAEGETSEDYCLINVYAPCNDDEQILLWDHLRLVVEQWEEANVCIIGDFNAITEVGERDKEGAGALSRGSRGLKKLIKSCRLCDVRLQGRSFTWYRRSGKCKSRIDRALVNEKWVDTW